MGTSDSLWITDDEAAFDFGQARGILTWDTRSLLDRLIADHELTVSDGFALATAMQDADRTPRRAPSSARELAAAYRS